MYSNPGLYYAILYASCHSRPPVCAAEFVSPAAVRSIAKREKADKYGSRKIAEEERSGRKEGRRRDEDELAVSKVFS